MSINNNLHVYMYCLQVKFKIIMNLETLGERTRTNSKLNRHDTRSGNQTWATLMESQFSPLYHPVPLQP